MILPNPRKQYPNISENVWISETATIIGDVTIGENVFIAPNAVIRADEPGSSIVIKDNCNIQDNVIIHSLSNSEVLVESDTSLAHRCIVHGPCKIGKGCFVGFGAVVFDCTVGDDSLVLHNATVRGVDVPAEKVVPDGQALNKQEDVELLEDVSQELRNFKASVINANISLVNNYREMAENA